MGWGTGNLGGGGASLNFKVVGGTSAPSNPKENTIWVNTSTTITDWVFKGTQPTAATGRVWILTGASSQVMFNALKKKWLYVYPISVKQYVNGAWVDKAAKSYQGGKWVEWWNGEYYENGKFYTDYKTKTNGQVNINSTAVEIVTVNDTASESFLVLGPQDITRFSKIDMTATHNYNNSGRSIVALFVAKTDNVSYKNAVAINSKTYSSCKIGDSASLSLDVSGLSGVYYVYAGLHSGGASWGRERKILITKIKAT